jgi:hypothetical protein
MQGQLTATPADLVRFARELGRIGGEYRAAHEALVAARLDEERCREASDKAGAVEALTRVVAHAQRTFDLFDQFSVLAVEIQPVISTAQKLAVLGLDVGLASAFRQRVSLIELVLVGVDAPTARLAGC